MNAKQITNQKNIEWMESEKTFEPAHCDECGAELVIYDDEQKLYHCPNGHDDAVRKIMNGTLR